MPEKSEDSKEKFFLIDHDKPSDSDWDIGNLYSKSWNIVKNNKVTWIFGAAVSALAAGSSGYSSNGGSSGGENIQKIFENVPKEATEGAKLTQVLGESTGPVQQLLGDIFHAIPIYFYLILGIEVAILIILGIVIRFIYSAWSNAGLIQSIQSAYLNKKPTIAESAQKAFPYIKSLIALELIPLLFFILVIPISIIVFVAAFWVGSWPLRIFFGLLLVVEVILLIYVSLVMTVGVIWGTRQVIISGKGAKEAFWSGIRIARRKFWSSILLGLVNTIVSGLISVIPIVIIIGIVVAGVVSYLMTETISPVLIVIGVFAFIVVMVAMTIIGAIVTAFKASVWTIAYNQIKGKYDK